MAEKIGITNLDVDSLSHIMLLVAQSPDGAINFARALSVNKSFLEFRNDPQLLKSVRFEDGQYPESFWGINGFLTRCACAQNLQACEILGKLQRTVPTLLMSNTLAIPSSVTYLAARRDVLKQMSVRAEEAKALKNETRDAHLAVGTRGRKRAANLANEESVRMSVDVIRESQALRDHCLVVINSIKKGSNVI